jgi:DNA-directed RNA polymerase alpha subunit
MKLEIQEQPISELNLTDSFKQMAKNQNLHTLNDLLQLTPSQILSIPGLTFEHLKEYRAFLSDHCLEHLQEKPAS